MFRSKNHLTVALIAVLVLTISAITYAQSETYSMPIPVPPDCAEIEGVEPEILIGGNLTISLGGLDFYESYVDQSRDSHLLRIDGEQLMGEDIELEGCFVDETEFHLFGTLGGDDILMIGMAIEPEFGEPSFGGIWYMWSRGYDPEVEPSEKGYFSKLF